MFDFEKLNVYAKAKQHNKNTQAFLESSKIHTVTANQLRRGSFSILLNIAEGSGRFTKADRSNFYIIARGSVFECVAIFDFLNDNGKISNKTFSQFYTQLEEISKMLFAMIRDLKKF